MFEGLLHRGHDIVPLGMMPEPAAEFDPRATVADSRPSHSMALTPGVRRNDRYLL
jgi:hypothetical protein